MVKVNSHGKTKMCIEVNIWTINSMGKVLLPTLMETNIQVSFKPIRSMVMGYIYGKMVTNIKVSIEMGTKVEKEPPLGSMARVI
jgi:hypothetical protein